MPRSPYRRSSSNERGKRDYRHVQKNSQDRFYGGQSRKKIHRDYPDRPKNEFKQQQRRKDQYDDRGKKYGAYDQRPVIRIQPKQSVQVKYSEPQSEIKIHFRFKPIQIVLNPRSQEDLIQKLKNHISQKIGPVEYFQRSVKSYPGFLILELGFKYDNDAISYLKGKFSQIDITIEKSRVFIEAEPTITFKLLIDQLEASKKKGKLQKEKSRSPPKTKKQKTKHKKKRSYSNSRSQSSDRSSSSDPSKESIDSRRDKSRQDRKDTRRFDQFPGDRRDSHRDNYNKQRFDYKPRGGQQKFKNSPLRGQNYQKQSKQAIQSKSQTEVKQFKQQKTLYFFGVHYSVNSKNMDDLFRNHQQGPFNHQELMWRRIKDSISEFLQGKFDKKHALRLLELSDKLQVKGHPFIIVDAQSIETDKLLQKIAQYQINIQFPRSVEPYHLLKGMMQCGRVVQIISNNKLTQQGRGQYYNVTFNSKQICSKLKALKKTSKEIIIEEVTAENAAYVYRPNFKTELMTVDYVQESKDDKSESRSVSRDRNRGNRSRSYDRNGDHSYDRNK